MNFPSMGVLMNEKLEEKIRNYEHVWESVWSSASTSIREASDPSLDWILKDIKKRNASIIASVPCGDFTNEKFLADQGIQVEGYDISKTALAKAREKCPGAVLTNHNILHGKLPRSYDIIIAIDFSMHLTNQSLLDFFDNIYLSLKELGVLYLNFLSPEDDTAQTNQVNPDNIALLNNDSILIKYRTRDEIEEIVKKTGFRIVDVLPYERKDGPHKSLTGTQQEHTHRGYSMALKKDFSSVEEAIEQIKQGKLIIIKDHREDEGDFFIPSEKATPDSVNFMLQYGRGVLCVSMLPERFQELGIKTAREMGINKNEARFGESIDYIVGTTTGSSAYDRSATIRAVAEKTVLPVNFRRNGHLRTLEADIGGIKSREGHTEASIELARLAGLYPSGVIIEILERGGLMAPEDNLINLSREYKIPIIKIGQLLRYKEKLYGQ